MRKVILLLVVVIIPLLSISQINRNEPKVKSDKYGNEVISKESDFGMLIGFGSSFNYFDSKTKKYLGNNRGRTYKLSLFYKNYLLRLAFKPVVKTTTKPTDIIYFNLPYNPGMLEVINNKIDIVLGYSFDLPYNFCFEPTLGYLRTPFVVSDTQGNEIESISKNVSGITAGFSINKYINITPLDSYIVVYIANSINYSNYSKFHPDLGDSFYSFELGLALKGWFMKKTKL